MDDKYQFIVGNLSASASADFLDSLGKRSPSDLFAALVAADRRNSDTGFRSTQGNQIRVDGPSNLISDDELERGPNVMALGKGIFWRWSSALHEFTCTAKAGDDDLRSRVLNAVTGNTGGGVAFLAAFLSVHFSLGAAESALIAALTVRLLGKPALEDVCATWSKSLNEHKAEV
jgi:hypothetical protein